MAENIVFTDSALNGSLFLFLLSQKNWAITPDSFSKSSQSSSGGGLMLGYFLIRQALQVRYLFTADFVELQVLAGSESASIC